jgi:guanylate kinase
MEEAYRAMIAAYQPSEHARKLLGKTPMLLMVGMSGVGRDTIISKLVARGGYYPLVTSTTRPPRSNNDIMERDGVEYHFLTKDQARGYLETGVYVEVSPVHDHINGLLTDELQRAYASGGIAITDMETQGALKYHQLSDNVIAIFVLPPSYEEWMRRNRKRYASDIDFNAAWPRRRQSAIMELEMALESSFYYFVVNDELGEAVDACDRIAHGRPIEQLVQQQSVALAHAILERLRHDKYE